MCAQEAIGASCMLRFIRRAEAWLWMLPTLDLICKYTQRGGSAPGPGYVAQTQLLKLQKSRSLSLRKEKWIFFLFFIFKERMFFFSPDKRAD